MNLKWINFIDKYRILIDKLLILYIMLFKFNHYNFNYIVGDYGF